MNISLEKLIQKLINELRQRKGLTLVSEIKEEDRLREDLALDSLDLAVLSIKIEKQTQKDILSSNRKLGTVGDIRKALT